MEKAASIISLFSIGLALRNKSFQHIFQENLVFRIVMALFITQGRVSKKPHSADKITLKDLSHFFPVIYFLEQQKNI